MKPIVTIIFLLFLHGLMGQGICTGNLGDNIFTDGDFGIGTSSVLQVNPNIAPGYQYTTSVPFDGAYTVCSRTGALGGLYPTWLDITDNSNDPNGYMMVVNADFEPGIFYEETVSGLCENTLYEFSADIINLIRIGVSDHIDPNVTFLIDDVVVYQTGNVPKTEQWIKYGFSFVTTASQSEVKLTLRNNAPGGTGNDLALDNISFRPCGPSSFIGLEGESSTIFLCFDDDPLTVVADIIGDDGAEYSIQWQSSPDSMVWMDIEGATSSSILHSQFDIGDYFYRYFSAGNEDNLANEKCRIISDILKITVLPETYNIIDTTCVGQSYILGDQVLTVSGDYSEMFVSSRGCDSLVLLDLTFVPENPINIASTGEDPSCFGFSDGAVIINNLTGGYGELDFLIRDNDNNEVNANLPAGTYTIISSDRFDCQETQQVTLSDPEEIFIELGLDTTVKLGEELIINPYYSEVLDMTQWMANGELDCEDCASVVFLPYLSDYIIGTVTDDNGCSDTDSLFINVIDESLVYLPNIFSPNDDRINDYMTIEYEGRSVAEIVQFSVFDRWGGLIVNQENIVIDSGYQLWDGYSQNTAVPNGVYAYQIMIRYINGKRETIVGSITVLR